MADPVKRCPKCGMPIPDKFSQCPACSDVLRADVTQEGGRSSVRASYIQRNILIAALGFVAVFLLFFLPRVAITSASPVPAALPTETAESETADEPETEEPKTTQKTADRAATVDSVVAAPGENGHTHVYVQTVTRNATCTEQGVATFTCECGNSYTRPIPALGHSWKDATCTEPRTCTRCGATEGGVLKHQTGADGRCVLCGASKADEMQAVRNQYDAAIQEKIATADSIANTYGQDARSAAACTQDLNEYNAQRNKAEGDRQFAINNGDADGVTLLENKIKALEEQINLTSIYLSGALAREEAQRLTEERDAKLREIENKYQ
ncbi:MAG: hypothetical protein J6Z79_05450 [Clostridia bacterium]|nr:hypothetical protein [Clostridia bacterium]